MRLVEFLHREATQIVIEEKYEAKMIDVFERAGISYRRITDRVLFEGLVISVYEYYTASSIRPLMDFVERELSIMRKYDNDKI